MVNLKRILGGLIVGLFFLVVFISTGLESGFLTALAGLGVVVVAVAFLMIAVFLISDEGDKLW